MGRSSSSCALEESRRRCVVCCLKRDKRGEMSLILENPGNDRRRDSITRINLRRNSNAGLKMARKNRYGSECQKRILKWDHGNRASP